MSSVDHNIDRLRAELADLTGTARVGPLGRLGQALLLRFTQNGLTAPSALPDLNAAVIALEEALDYIAEDDPLRANVSFYLGFALGCRNNFVNDDKDRDAAIDHLGEALSSDRLTAPLAANAQVLLGSQYMHRAMAPMASSSMSMMGLLNASANQTQIADIDRAADCFRAVLDGEFISADVREMAQMSLEMTEASRAMLGGSPGGYNLQNMMSAFATIQKMQEKYTSQAKPGYGAFQPSDALAFGNLGKLINTNPLDLPVAVVEGVAEDVADVEPPAVSKPEPVVPEPDPVDLRGSLRKRLSLTDPGVPAWEAAAALLLPDADIPPVDIVDDAVAMASTVVDQTVVEQDGEPAPEDAAVDWFLLAVTLHLRDRVDSGGDGADRRSGADALLTAARRAPADHPAAPVILRSLGAFLSPDTPFGGVLDRVAAGFTGRFDAVLAGDSVTDPDERANLHALRCVCRAAWAVGEVGRAVDQVSPGYPWPDPLKAAARSSG